MDDREQARLDLAAIANLTSSQAEEVKHLISVGNVNGQDRLKILLNSNVTTRQYAKKAIDTGNHVTEKFITLTQALTDSKSVPQEVHVMNQTQDAVPVTSQPPTEFNATQTP